MGLGELIDVTFEFRSDTPPGRDPDSYSPTLRRHHQLLWSKPLPSGTRFDLDVDTRPYLHDLSELGEFWLSSDAVMPTFSREPRLAHVIAQIPEAEREAFRRVGCTIGGMMVFPANLRGLLRPAGRGERAGAHGRVLRAVRGLHRVAAAGEPRCIPRVPPTRSRVHRVAQPANRRAGFDGALGEPVSAGELRRSRRVARLAASHDRKRRRLQPFSELSNGAKPLPRRAAPRSRS